jgi:AcrR family transcriptional regulator
VIEVRLEDIARRAGVSRQSVYVHFGSRAGLVLALVQRVDTGGMLEGLVQRVFDAPTSLDALDAIVHLHAEYSPVAYPVARVLMAGRHEDEALRVAWDDRMEARRNLYRDTVERLQREGLLSARWDVATATDLVFALTSWEVWELLAGQRWSKDQYREHLSATLRRTLVDGAA